MKNMVYLFLLISSLAFAKEDKKILRLPAGGDTVVFSLYDHYLGLKSEDGKESSPENLPHVGFDDEWVSVEAVPLGDRQFVQLKIWATPQGTKKLERSFLWVVYEIKDGQLQLLTNTEALVIPESKDPHKVKPPKLQLKLDGDKLKFFRDKKEIQPEL
jgi:hypothetical protein